MALTGDVKVIRDGTPGNASQPVNQPVKALQTIYRGSVAITRSGYAYPATSPQSSDVVWGIVDKYGPGFADTAPGIVGGATDGAVTMEIATGSFFLANVSTNASDIATQASVGLPVYLVDETHFSMWNDNGLRPLAGVLNRIEPFMSAQYGLFSVKLGAQAGGTGAPQ